MNTNILTEFQFCIGVPLNLITRDSTKNILLHIDKTIIKLIGNNSLKSLLKIEAAVHRCSVKKVFLKIL